MYYNTHKEQVTKGMSPNKDGTHCINNTVKLKSQNPESPRRGYNFHSIPKYMKKNMDTLPSPFYNYISPMNAFPQKGGETHYWILNVIKLYKLQITLPEHQPISLHKQQYQQRKRAFNNHNTWTIHVNIVWTIHTKK